MTRLILDLCGGTGAWSAPFLNAGYDVHVVDIKRGPSHDVRTYSPPQHVWGVLAAPPCTVFALGGARWWATRPVQEVQDACDVVRACLRIVREAQPAWWALENPKGRLRALVPELGKPAWWFNPYEYMDFYSKLTYVWGNVTKPPPTVPDVSFAASISRPAILTVGRAAPYTRVDQRAITPPGFADAFCEHVQRSFARPLPDRLPLHEGRCATEVEHAS